MRRAKYKFLVCLYKSKKYFLIKLIASFLFAVNHKSCLLRVTASTQIYTNQINLKLTAVEIVFVRSPFPFSRYLKFETLLW
jgi:hypothetical protein